MQEKPNILSCIQPTSEMHIGNYFGAVSNWVNLQNSEAYDCIYGVVDLHAMTMPYNPKDLRQNTINMALDLIACGINPEKSVLFVQSLVPEHTELCWILSCIGSYGELTRMTQFKEKSERLNEELKEINDDDSEKSKSGPFISTGLFTYPILQAADILVYRAKYVPVGKDQEQHLELSRSIAKRFNFRFGDLFPEPEPLFTETPKIMSLADPQKKMSKSLGDKHCIKLFEEEDLIRSKIRSAVTDIGPKIDGEISPGVMNLFTILKSCGKEQKVFNMMEDYNKGILKYVYLKNEVSIALIELISSFKERRKELFDKKGNISRKIVEMSMEARKIAIETIKLVREKVGLPPRFESF